MPGLRGHFLRGSVTTKVAETDTYWALPASHAISVKTSAIGGRRRAPGAADSEQAQHDRIRVQRGLVVPFPPVPRWPSVCLPGQTPLTGSADPHPRDRELSRKRHVADDVPKHACRAQGARRKGARRKRLR
ncbi:hypothetical protein WOLCODRAFT_160671 [Wolfiporia cocos MD-104 SS10]|uniref:Uncharacterized protein n=1 Tax=Wolfiporia cocos (strain MD-104) TaxID=742152 RepID=A0A2H3IXL3_WOLCO|nr:hypothetical protein WOLCODRAFT_160671 [Wolfiporia cocos MD-104 SS10]